MTLVPSPLCGGGLGWGGGITLPKSVLDLKFPPAITTTQKKRLDPDSPVWNACSQPRDNAIASREQEDRKNEVCLRARFQMYAFPPNCYPLD
jgi:hypothetical protein